MHTVVVSKIVGKADEAALTWDLVLTLTDDELERVVYGTQKAPSATRATLDFRYLHAERKRPGVTLALLHVEYLEKCPDGYRYTQFCELYRAWLGRRGLTMRLDHRAGDKAFVDYSGVKLHIGEPASTPWPPPASAPRPRALGRRPRGTASDLAHRRDHVRGPRGAPPRHSECCG